MKERNYGVDLLRLLSMYMICVLHTLGHGGVLGSVLPFTGAYWVAWALEVLGCCAINCFGLISGYVMYNSRVRVGRLFELWLQIALYSVVITAVMAVIYPDVRGVSVLLNTLFPVTRYQYWYLSSYFGMYILLPVLNIGIERLPKITLRNCLLAAFFGMGFLPTVLLRDPYQLGAGYSMLWLCMLYLAGGYIGKYGLAAYYSTKKLLLVFFGAIGITYLSKGALDFLSLHFFGEPKGGATFFAYTSPTVIVAGVCLFLLCARLQVGVHGAKFIAFLAPATLGVYILHEHPFVRAKWILYYAVPFVQHTPVVMCLLVLVGASAIFTGCLAVDLLRGQLFKLLKVKQLCSSIDSALVSRCAKTTPEGAENPDTGASDSPGGEQH